MRSVPVLRPILFAALLSTVTFAAGDKARAAASNNKGKIEGTQWSSLAANVKGQALPAGLLQLEFGKDGSMVYRIGPKLTFKGTYSLEAGDRVTFHLTQPLAGKKDHTETIVIKADTMTVTDQDGTGLTFSKKK